MIGSASHLHEDGLFECYVAERGGEAPDPSSARHLSTCGDCLTRYEELARFMESLREEAEGETDAVFTPRELELQRQQIHRRIEHLSHPTRVLRFPGRLMRRDSTGTMGRFTSRRGVAAVAAGLVVGVGVGLFFDARRHTIPPSMMVAPARVASPVVVASIPATVEPVIDDDAFLSELEAALGGPLYSQELLPFDALTPRVQDISSRPLRY